MEYKALVYIKTSQFVLFDINIDKTVSLFSSDTPHLLPASVTKEEFQEYFLKVYNDYKIEFDFKDLELIEVVLTIKNKKDE